MKIHKTSTLTYVDVREYLSESNPVLWERFEYEYKHAHCKDTFAGLIVLDSEYFSYFLAMLYSSKLLELAGVSPKHCEEALAGIQQIEEEHEETIWWIIQ
jgi:hypothetical protein